jgi:hypothetical protein
MGRRASLAEGGPVGVRQWLAFCKQCSAGHSAHETLASLSAGQGGYSPGRGVPYLQRSMTTDATNEHATQQLVAKCFPRHIRITAM